MIRVNPDFFDAVGSSDCNWAQLQANERTTRYLKCGRGEPVLLLLRDSNATDTWPAIAARLAADHRVFVPEFTWPARELGDWLGGFLDCTGVGPVTLIAANDLCMAALQVALREPERVARLVLAPEPVVDHEAIVSHLSVHQDQSHTPLLILDVNAPAAESISALERFLASAE